MCMNLYTVKVKASGSQALRCWFKEICPIMNSHRALRQRLIFVVRITLFALVLLAILIPTALGAGFIAVLTTSVCSGGPTPPMPYEDVSFPSTEFSRATPAYFIP